MSIGVKKWRAVVKDFFASIQDAVSKLRVLRRFNGWPFPRLPIKPVSPKAKVLFATISGGHQSALPVDLLLARTLRVLGYDAKILFCAGEVPACLLCVETNYSSIDEFLLVGPGRSCKSCKLEGTIAARILAVPVLRTKMQSEGNEQGDLEHARAGAIRFLAGADENSSEYAKVFQQYVKADSIYFERFMKVLREFKPNVVVIHHGIYVPQGTILRACRELGIRVVTWNTAYRRNTFIFSHDESYHKTMLTEPTDAWEERVLSAKERTNLISYLESREVGESDWISFNRGVKEFDVKLPEQSKVALLLTNVSWDAQVFYSGIAFGSMEEWIVSTVNWFRSNPSLHLIIRVHPAERTGLRPARVRVRDLLASTFTQLPKNVHLVDAESELSTYKLMRSASLGLIYGTKAGVEMTCRGIPTVVAGDAWIKNKGLTIDPKSQKQYFNILDDWSKGNMSMKPDVEKALKYAHYFFFRKMIEVKSVTNPNQNLSFVPNPPRKNSQLEMDPGLRVVIKGIVEGDDFLMPL